MSILQDPNDPTRLLRKTFFIDPRDPYNMCGNRDKFKVGDKAYKPKGYKFPCTIVSVFTTTEGKIRIVGEMDDNGMLHIFNEDQLELITTTQNDGNL